MWRISGRTSFLQGFSDHRFASDTMYLQRVGQFGSWLSPAARIQNSHQFGHINNFVQRRARRPKISFLSGLFFICWRITGAHPNIASGGPWKAKAFLVGRITCGAHPLNRKLCERGLLCVRITCVRFSYQAHVRSLARMP